jgi:hypothetical protein
MAQEYKYEDELSVVRRQNSALRSINRSLRKRLLASEAHSDEIFTALCGEDPEQILEAEPVSE